jgi:hypothetical protein
MGYLCMMVLLHRKSHFENMNMKFGVYTAGVLILYHVMYRVEMNITHPFLKTITVFSLVALPRHRNPSPSRLPASLAPPHPTTNPSQNKPSSNQQTPEIHPPFRP